MQIVTRSAHPVLYDRMRRMFTREHTFHRRVNYTSAVDYLHDLFVFDGIVVNCDEDCFVTRETAIDELVTYMRAHKYAYCGMPDGGVIHHRFNSWANVNPFFNIFDMDAIRPLYDQWTRTDIDNFFTVDESKRPPALPYAWAHNRSEPFAGLFYWLHYHFTPLFLNVQEHVDGLSTILLDIHDKPFAYHSWWSRRYESRRGREHTQRIDALYTEACLAATFPHTRM